MKKIYETPAIELQTLDTSDILTESGIPQLQEVGNGNSFTIGDIFKTT